MKTHPFSILFCLAAVCLCGACANEDAPPPPAADCISFDAPRMVLDEDVGANGARSTLVTSLAEGSTFSVLGYCVPYTAEAGGVSNNPDWAAASMPWKDKSNLSHADVFYKQTVTVTAAGAAYTPLKPWIVKDASDAADVSASWQYLYSFMAYSPVDKFSVAPSDAAAAGPPVLTFTMPFQGVLMTGTLDHESVPDALVAADFDIRRGDGKVPLTFNHILTGLQFKVGNYSDDELIIEKISLFGKFYRTATFDFTGDTVRQTVIPLDEDSYNGEYDLSGGTMSVAPSEIRYAGGDGIESGTRLLLLYDPEATPETAAAGTRYSIGSEKILSVKYRFANDTSSRTWTLQNFRLSYQPKRNTCYTARLNFIGKDFVLIFESDGKWANGSNNEIIIQ